MHCSVVRALIVLMFMQEALLFFSGIQGKPNIICCFFLTMPKPFYGMLANLYLCLLLDCEK